MNPDLNIEVPNNCPNNPLVSVCITTYNHEAFIRQCIESVLEQRADFEYEILIGEDDSTDATRAICKDIARNHPQKVRLFLNDRANVLLVNGRPTGRNNLKHLFLKARGRYVAFIEGDDYYSDPQKLKKQVDALVTYPSAAICSTACTQLFEEDGKQKKLPTRAGLYTFKQVLDGVANAYTCTLMFRKIPEIYFPDWYDTTPYGDIPLIQLHLSRGGLVCIPDNTAVYRVHSRGYYSGAQPMHRARMYMETIHVLSENLISINPSAGPDCFAIPKANAYYRMAYSAAGVYEVKEALRYFIKYVRIEKRTGKRIRRIFLFPFILIRLIRPNLG